MTDKQAVEIARNLLDAGFRIYGLGNFDIFFEDLIEVVTASSKSKADTIAIYKKLEEENMT